MNDGVANCGVPDGNGVKVGNGVMLAVPVGVSGVTIAVWVSKKDSAIVPTAAVNKASTSIPCGSDSPPQLTRKTRIRIGIILLSNSISCSASNTIIILENECMKKSYAAEAGMKNQASKPLNAASSLSISRFELYPWTERRINLFPCQSISGISTWYSSYSLCFNVTMSVSTGRVEAVIWANQVSGSDEAGLSRQSWIRFHVSTARR
jgi:hypothetical protein